MKIKTVPFILSTIALILLVSFPDKYLGASMEGLKIYVNNVLPALLPFMFFSKLLTSSGIDVFFEKLFSKPCRKAYNTSGKCGYVLCMSMLSGYPIGAKLLLDEYETNNISQSEIKTAIAFTSTSGPMFILGTVGALMLQNQLYGIIILVCHYLSALINGFIYRRKRTQGKTVVISSHLNQRTSIDIYDVVVSVLSCGAYVALFYMIAVMLEDLKILSFLSGCINLLFHDENVSNGIAFGLVEMTGGCLKLANTSSFFTLPAICAIISFGGFSISLQSLTFLKKCGIKPLRYLISKITQSIIAFFISCLAVVFFL